MNDLVAMVVIPRLDAIVGDGFISNQAEDFDHLSSVDLGMMARGLGSDL